MQTIIIALFSISIFYRLDLSKSEDDDPQKNAIVR